MKPDKQQPYYRILSLDGGGTWALLQVMALQNFFRDALGHEVLRDFDLVAANSGGSITAGGLVTNLPLSEILDYFCDHSMRSKIFNPLPFALVWGSPFRYIFHRFVRRDPAHRRQIPHQGKAARLERGPPTQ